MKKQTKLICPKCGAEAKQFHIPKTEIYSENVRGRYYCDRCGWLEDHDVPIPSLIRKQAGEHKK